MGLVRGIHALDMCMGLVCGIHALEVCAHVHLFQKSVSIMRRRQTLILRESTEGVIIVQIFFLWLGKNHALRRAADGIPRDDGCSVVADDQCC